MKRKNACLSPAINHTLITPLFTVVLCLISKGTYGLIHPLSLKTKIESIHTYKK